MLSSHIHKLRIGLKKVYNDEVVEKLMIRKSQFFSAALKLRSGHRLPKVCDGKIIFIYILKSNRLPHNVASALQKGMVREQLQCCSYGTLITGYSYNRM